MTGALCLSLVRVCGRQHVDHITKQTRCASGVRGVKTELGAVQIGGPCGLRSGSSGEQGVKGLVHSITIGGIVGARRSVRTVRDNAGKCGSDSRFPRQTHLERQLLCFDVECNSIFDSRNEDC